MTHIGRRNTNLFQQKPSHFSVGVTEIVPRGPITWTNKLLKLLPILCHEVSVGVIPGGPIRSCLDFVPEIGLIPFYQIHPFPSIPSILRSQRAKSRTSCTGSPRARIKINKKSNVPLLMESRMKTMRYPQVP